MAVGDVISDIQSIAASAYLDIQPGAGVEYVIHNIYHEDQVEVYFYDGTNNLLFDSDSGKGDFQGIYHCENVDRIRVKNTAGTSKLIGYDGVQTK